METWTGCHFSIERNINSNIIAFQVDKIKDNYFLSKLESIIEEISKFKIKHTFFIDNPNKHDFIIVLELLHDNILVHPIKRSNLEMQTINIAYTIPINIIKNIYNEEIYIEYKYNKISDINFKLLSIKNCDEILPKLFVSNNKIISKIHLLMNNEYLVISLKKINKLDYLAITLFIIYIDNFKEIHFSKTYNFFIKNFDDNFTQ